MPITVLHKDAAFAVIDKPAGLPVEADSKDSVVAYLSRELGPPGGRAWPRVVHRLDRDTSGCMAVALNKKGEAGFLELFQQGQVEKRYLALVAGAPPDEDALDTAYGQDPRDKRRFTTKVQSAKRARLQYRVRERLRGAALVEVLLDTGRTHQIRVQLSEAGFPVVGDAVYGGPKAEAVAVKTQLARVGLHAEHLSFPHPVLAERTLIECTAALPDDSAAALAALRL